MPPFYRGEKLRAQGHTGHLTSASSAFNPHAAFAFSSASTPFREGLGFFFFPFQAVSPSKGRALEICYPFRFFSERPPPFHPAPLPRGPPSQHLLQGQFKLPIGPQSGSGPLRGAAGEPRAPERRRRRGRGRRGAQPAAPPGLGSQRAAAGGAGGCVREEAACAGGLRGGAAGNGESRSAGPAGAAAGRGVGWPRGRLPTYAGRHIDEVEQRGRQREEEERGEQRAARQPQQPPAGAHAEPAAARGPTRAPLLPLRSAAWASAAAFRASRAAASPLSAAGRRGPGHMRQEGGRGR